jgi:integrase
VDGEKLDRNPFNGVDLLTENNRRSRELTPDEEVRLFERIPETPQALRPYFRFLLATGARASEACGLAWQALLWTDGAAELPETKAGTKQYLILSAETQTILRDLPRLGPRVFCWPDGRPLTVDFTTHAFRKAVVAAGSHDLRQHDLRRLCHPAAAWWGQPGGGVGPAAPCVHPDERTLPTRHGGGPPGGGGGWSLSGCARGARGEIPLDTLEAGMVYSKKEVVHPACRAN